MNKLLIKNATVFDGTSSIAGYDVLVEEDLIKELSKNIIEPNAQIVDAKNMYLCPGFIDIHTHSDIATFVTDSENFLSQGVTTVVGGNCGISGGLNNDPSIEGIINMDNYKYPAFNSIQEYISWIKGMKCAVNYGSLIGYHTLVEESLRTNQYIETILKKYLDLGFLGLSYGLVYGNGKNINSTNALENVSTILNERSLVLATHIKDQAGGLFDAVKMFTDLIEGGKNPNLKLQISHLKHMIAQDPNGEKTLTKTLELMDKLHANYNIGTDTYPYTAGSTLLSLKDRYKQCINGWYDVFPYKYSESIGVIADNEDKTPAEVVADILAVKPDILAVYKNSMREVDVWKIIDKPYTSIASDGLLTHPRNWGTFTKVIKYVLDNNLDIDMYLKKLTSLPASQIGLKNQGRIKSGYKANLVMFDPKKIADNATYECPNKLSIGVMKVWVNGKLAFAEGKIESLSGKLLF